MTTLSTAVILPADPAFGLEIGSLALWLKVDSYPAIGEDIQRVRLLPRLSQVRTTAAWLDRHRHAALVSPTRREATMIAGAVDLRYSQNHGIAFNVERFVPEAIRKLLIFAGALAALAFIGITWFRRRRNPSIEHVAYAMILGGALGNLLDRLFRGYVADFVHIHGWPIFNVADVAICVGVGLLMFHAYRNRAAEIATG